jgi:hypothetical protein
MFYIALFILYVTLNETILENNEFHMVNDCI